MFTNYAVGCAEETNLVPRFGTLALFLRRTTENGRTSFSDVSSYPQPAFPVVRHTNEVLHISSLLDSVFSRYI